MKDVPLSESVLAQAEAQALHYITMQRYEQALRALEPGFRDHPMSPSLHFLKATAELGLERHSEARKSLEVVLAAQPDHLEAGLFLARILEAEKNHLEAERLLLELARKNPTDTAPVGQYGGLLLRAGKLERAREILIRVLEINPTDEVAKVQLLLADYVTGRKSGIETEVIHAFQTAPESRVLGFALIHILVTQHREKDAFELARQLVLANPADKDAVELLKSMRLSSHPALWILKPYQRFKSFGPLSWVALLFVMRLLKDRVPEAFLLAVVSAYLLLAIYSHVGPPILKRWIEHRGIRA